MALTLGEYIYKYLDPSSQNTELHMNVSDMVVLHAQVVSPDSTKEHLICVDADLDWATQQAHLRFFAPTGPSDPAEPFATCTVRYEHASAWAREWRRVSHLVRSRIAAVHAHEAGNRVGRALAYSLFGNVVDYAPKYRGMRSVTMVGAEAVADVALFAEQLGTWHSPPHYIDSVCHVGGFVLNAGEDYRESFYVTPGWGSFRMMGRMRGGETYQSYVRMAPTGEQNMFSGDVYILQGEEIVGVMEEMKFRRVARVLMNRFFSPAEGGGAGAGHHDASVKKVKAVAPKPLPTPLPVPAPAPRHTPAPLVVLSAPTPPAFSPSPSPVILTPPQTDEESLDGEENSTVQEALLLICRESGLEMEQLKDEALFAEVGIDSLMSLVLAEKFRSELQLEVKSSLFLECANVKAFKEWLADYC